VDALAAQVDTIEQLSWLPLLGKIDLRTPQHKFWLLRAETANNNGVPSMPDRLYFGREVALGQRQLVDQ
jgi:tRNA (guanine10-N2)-methyltransferase